MASRYRAPTAISVVLSPAEQAGPPDRDHRVHAAESLLPDQSSGAAHLGWHVLLLWQPVLHGQHGILVVDVQRRSERQVRDDRRIDVRQPPERVLGQEMTAARPAPLPDALLGLLINTDVVG